MRYEQLPEEFLSRMKRLLDGDYEDYLKSFGRERYCGLRVNTGKVSVEAFEELAPFPLEKVEWIDNGYYYRGEDKPAKDPYYYAGLYYLQEPSAMTPASVLPVAPGDRVLDLCAAPGGKSTELGVKLKGEGILFSNDISSSRAKALLKNLELFGLENICVASEAPEKLALKFPEYFDKILVDAPCSGEGMFCKDEGMVKSWLDKGPECYVPIQQKILLEAEKMLKPGGMMLYSTCTFDQREDEEMMRWLLSNRPCLTLVNLEKKEGFLEGCGCPECVRLFPHKIRGEGHFIALVRKDEKKIGGPKEPSDCRAKASRELSFSFHQYPEFQEFLSLIQRQFDETRFQAVGSSIYYLPKGYAHGGGIRYLRTGLLMGEQKKGRFEPSQALAMALKMEEFQAVYNLKREDERVIRYLKGETVSLEGQAKGWHLICVDGFPLGFAKGTGASLKNKYYPGWRWQ